MVTYSNGYIPSSLLVTFNVGRSAGEGEWKHQLSPATYAKHLALVALARKNTGRTLTLSNGWSGYRPYSAQMYARQRYGNGAAWPGTSSHGGFWEGQQTLAIDYGNWSYVYNGSRDAFYRDCRAVGFEPGLISPQRGYPDEPWHVVDKNPWAAVPAGSGVSTGGASTITPKSEEDDMLFLIVNYKKGAHRVALGNKTFRHFIGTDPYIAIAKNAGAEWKDIQAGELDAYLRTYGCDIGGSVYRSTTGETFEVLDPITGKYGQGNVWTAENAIRAALAKK